MSDCHDQKILALLVSDARLSASDIARQVNLFRSAVTEPIRRMENNDTIADYHAHISSSMKEGMWLIYPYHFIFCLVSKLYL